jgi:hypothetical protein
MPIEKSLSARGYCVGFLNLFLSILYKKDMNFFSVFPFCLVIAIEVISGGGRFVSALLIISGSYRLSSKLLQSSSTTSIELSLPLDTGVGSNRGGAIIKDGFDDSSAFSIIARFFAFLTATYPLLSFTLFLFSYGLFDIDSSLLDSSFCLSFIGGGAP